jgi:hypothetical protein
MAQTTKYACAAALTAVLALGIAACGDSGGGAAPAATGGQRAGMQLTDEQRTCLQKEGVDLAQGGRRPGGGQDPQAPGDGQSPGQGQRPPLSDEQRQQFEQQRAERTKAFDACGIKLPDRGPGGPGGGVPPQGSATPGASQQ